MAAGEEEQEAGIPEWVVTFGDMMSLLLTFFVMLVSMSEIKQEQSMALVESLRRQFGYNRSPLSLMPGRFSPTPSSLNKLPSLGRARRMDTMKGGDKVKAPQGDYARVMAIRPSDDSTLGGVIYFEEGSAELTDSHKETLRQAAPAISGKPQKIEIRGHTSSRPLEPDSPYRDHFDLGYARCSKVREVLVRLGVNPKRISMRVAGPNEPIHTGYDPLLRKRNARVEVFLLDEMAEDLPAAGKTLKKPANPESPGGP
jgi:chemotaxis protein MotB